LRVSAQGVEEGNASGRFHALTDKVADIALIPFMASLAIDVAITGAQIFGTGGGIAAGVAVGVLATEGRDGTHEMIGYTAPAFS
jgi:hypothetical protein